jgi:hypothetical protein
MDTASRITLEIMELEDKIEQAIEDWQPELVQDYQEELDTLEKKLIRIQNTSRKQTKKRKSWDLFS